MSWSDIFTSGAGSPFEAQVPVKQQTPQRRSVHGCCLCAVLSGPQRPLTCRSRFRCTGSHCGPARRPSPRDCALCCRSSFSPWGWRLGVCARLSSPLLLSEFQIPCCTQAPPRVLQGRATTRLHRCVPPVWTGARARSVKRKAEPGLQPACWVRRERGSWDQIL